MNVKQDRMLQGPLLRNILLYTFPIILTGVLQLLFNAADLVVVGRFCGSISVAAVGATGSVTNLIVNLFIGLSVGAGVSVAHGLGGRQEEAVRRTVHTALPLALVSGVVLTVAGILLAPALLRLMGTPEDVLPLSSLYMRIYFGGITFTMVYNFCASILRAAGDSRTPLIFLTIAGVVNVGLNVIFVTQLGMNVEGVALATIISQAISAALVLLALMRRADACRLVLKDMRFYGSQLGKILRIGLPAGIQSSVFAISNVLIQSSVNSFGSVFMSGNAAAANIEGFVYVAMNAFHQTAVNFIGQNTGAGLFGRIRKIFWACIGCVTVTGLVLGISGYVFGEQLLGIYITDSPQAIQYGLLRLSLVCVPYCLCGMMDVASGALRGLGSSLAPMLLTIVGVCGFRILWVLGIFSIPRFHTPQSLYLSYPISWFATYTVLFFAFLLIFRDMRRKLGK